MAQATRSNVIVIDTNSDTRTGPLTIVGVRVLGGAASSSASITQESTVIWQSATVGAGGLDESRLPLKIGGGVTLTFGLAGTGTKLYIHTA